MQPITASLNTKLVLYLDVLENTVLDAAHHLSRILDKITPNSSAHGYRTSSAVLRRASRKAAAAGITYAPPPSARGVSHYRYVSPPRALSLSDAKRAQHIPAPMIDLDFDVPVLDTASSLWSLKSGPLSRPTVEPLKSKPAFCLNIISATPINDSSSQFSDETYDIDMGMLFADSSSTIETL
ncbi:hypothetical protein HWV62_10401 [Athelia sp. TMB]|nr:hypothetical protein HWV62_10401 [Athelia sp. TMB]